MLRNLRKALSALVAVVLLMQGAPLAALGEIIVESSKSVRLFEVEPGAGNVYVTYEFYNGDALVASQIVNQTAGERPSLTPVSPSEEGGEFLGWFYEDGTRYEAGVETAYAENTTVTVQAKFSEVYYAYFMTVEEDGARAVLSTQRAVAENLYRVAAPDDYEPKGALVTAWVRADDSETTFAPGAQIALDADAVFYPAVTPCYWVNFNTLGGSQVSSINVSAGETLDLSEIAPPTRTGYTFKGWSKAPSGAESVSSIAPDEDVTLYAIWEEAQVPYTIVYWGENADDALDTVLAVAESTALNGSTVALDAASGALPESVADREHFAFESAESAVIAADGSSVINVYFSRRTYTLSFYAPVYTCGLAEHRHTHDACCTRTGWHSQCNTKKCPRNGVEHVHTESCGGDVGRVAEIRAKYGADISGRFDEAPFNTTYNGRAWKCTDSKKYGYALQTLDRMPGFDARFNLYDKSSNALKTIYYYVQRVDSTQTPTSWPSAPGNDYELLKKVDTYFNYATYQEEYHPIQGFERFSASEAGFRNDRKDFSQNALSLYYKRNSYKLTFNNYGALNAQSVKYGASLAGYADDVPERPQGFSADAQFQGWYAVEPGQITEATAKFDFASARMPAGDRILYACWAEPRIDVTITVTVQGKDWREVERVPRGTAISACPNYAAAMAYIRENNLALLRWVDEEGKTVNVHEPLYRSASIRAVFVGETFAVRYTAGAGTGTPPVDDKRYEPGTAARAASGANLSAEGMVFAGWKDAATGKVYQPGQMIPIVASDVTLVAQYAPVEGAVEILYHSNFGVDAIQKVVALKNNQSVMLADYASLDALPPRAGYAFVGWALTAAAAAADYRPGDRVRVNCEGSNDLYAVWKRTSYALTLGKSVADETTLKPGDTFVLTWAYDQGDERVGGSATATWDGGKFAYENNVVEVPVGARVSVGESGADDWTATVSRSDFIMTEDTAVTVTNVLKRGRVGYDLTLPGAAIDATGWARVGNQRWIDETRRYETGEGFIVTQRVPTLEGHAFLAWHDRAQVGIPAKLVTGGQGDVYNRADGEAQILDAVWAHIAAEDVACPYDGAEHTIDDAALAFDGALDAALRAQLNARISLGELRYGTEPDGEFAAEKPAFTDVGTYTVYVKGAATVGERTYTLTTSATVTITPVYVVKYYAGSVDPANKLGETSYLDPRGAAAITLAAGTAEGQLNWKKPAAGYQDGVQRGGTIHPTENVSGIDVLYAENANVTIFYEATAGGGVSRAHESLAPATGVAQGSVATAAAGYRFVDWTDAAGDEVSASAAYVPAKVDGLNVAATYTANFTPNEDTAYTVYHYTQDLVPEGGAQTWTLAEEEQMAGTTGEKVTAQSRAIPGFTFDPSVSGTVVSGEIAGDGSLKLKLYYTRNCYKVTYRYAETVPGASALPGEETHSYGAEVALAADATAEGYAFSGWNTVDAELSAGKFTMPAGDVTIVGSFRRDFVKYPFAVAPYEGLYDATAHGVTVTDTIEGDTIEYATSDAPNARWSPVAPAYVDVIRDAQGRVAQAPVYVRATNGGAVSAVEESFVRINPVAIELYDAATEVYADVEHALTIDAEDVRDGKGAVPGEALTVTGATIRGTYVGVYDGVDAFEWSVRKADGAADSTMNYTLAVSGLLCIVDEGVDPDAVVNKTHDANRAYTLGSAVTFAIEVKNIYDAAKTITLEEIDGVTLAQSVFEGVQPGATIATTATYAIAEQDVIHGEFVNRVTARFSDGASFENTDAVLLAPMEARLEKTKVTLGVKIADGGYREKETYALGDEIWYRITIRNGGNVTCTDVAVEDALTGLRETTPSLAPGETARFETAYKVTEEDIRAGVVENYAQVRGGTTPTPAPSGTPRPTPVPTAEPEVNPTPDTRDETDPVDATLEVVKAALGVKKDGGYEKKAAYALNDEIFYRITVTNRGNVSYANVQVSDAKTGLDERIALLGVGATAQFITSHVVTEADVLAGMVENTATAKADPINGQKVEGSGFTADATDARNARLTVTKTAVSTPENGGAYALGETIVYEICVANDGNLTIRDIDVTDSLLCAGGGVIGSIDALAPGEERRFGFAHVVTEAEILAGRVVNVATATGLDPEGGEPQVIPGKREDPTVDPSPEMAVEKKLTNLPEKGYFTVGETAEFEIDVRNIGNLTLRNLVVTEALAGAEILGGAGYDARGHEAVVAMLAPGESVVVRARYTVSRDDLGERIVNAVSVRGEGAQDPDDRGDEEEIPTDGAVEIAGVKGWDDFDNAYATRPESITLRLTANGDEIDRATARADGGWAYRFARLPRHTPQGAEIVYRVTEDAVAGYDAIYGADNSVVNALERRTLTIRYWYGEIGGAVAAPTLREACAYGQSYDVRSPEIPGYTASAERVYGVMEGDAEYDVVYAPNRYTLTVNYVYQNGATAAPSYTQTLQTGEAYEKDSPVLRGYTASRRSVFGVMPGRDLVYTVIYVPDTVEVVVDACGVPLGIGNVEMNVGDCFE